MAILDDLKKLENELTAVGKNVAGKITIAASTIPSAYLLPRLAADFASLHPRISFEIRTFDSGQVVKTLLANENLLGFVGAASETEKLQYHPFMKDQLVLAVSSRKKINQRITARSLLDLPFILREEGSGTRTSLEQFLRQKDLSLDQFNICAVLGSSTAVTEAVKNNLGVSILSRHAVKDAVNYGQVQIIDIIGLEMSRDFYAVIPRKRSLPHHYQVFLKYVLQSPERDTE